MAKLVLTEAFVEIDGVDMSCWANNVEITLSKAEVDANTFCGQDTLAGLEESSFSIGLVQDFDAAAVDATLFPLWDEESTFTVVVRPDRIAAVSGTNPEYSGTCRLLEYQPLSGGPGDLAEISIDLKVIGSMARAVA